MSSRSQANAAIHQSTDVLIREILKRTAERSSELERALLWCAVPRWLDVEVVEGMVPRDAESTLSMDEIVQYLRALPFCEPHLSRDNAWLFREEFRTELLRHKTITEHQDELQLRAADLFEKRFHTKASIGERKFQDRGLPDIAIEYVYHL